MKLVLDEPESEVTELTWRAASSVASTRLLLVEVRSALARARRGGRLRPQEALAATGEARRLLDSVDLVEVEPAIVAEAAGLAERHGLRGYDAVHLASALALRDPELVVATWDADLAMAAHAEGLAVAS